MTQLQVTLNKMSNTPRAALEYITKLHKWIKAALFKSMQNAVCISASETQPKSSHLVVEPQIKCVRFDHHCHTCRHGGKKINNNKSKETKKLELHM